MSRNLGLPDKWMGTVFCEEESAMKLVKAQVRNFRSVEDSTEFSVDELLTCFVGKNESGKTALLTAMYRLNPAFETNATFDRTRDYPRRHLLDYEERHADGEAIAISTEWRLEERDVSRVREALGPKGLKSNTVRVIRRYDNKQTWLVETDDAAVLEHLLDGASLHAEERQLLAPVATIGELHQKLASPPGDSPRFLALKARIEATFPQNDPTLAVQKLLTLPKFMMFSQYQRMEGQVSLEQLRQRLAQKQVTEADQVFLALCEMAGTTVEHVATINQFEQMIARFEASSIRVSQEIFRYWSQNRFLKIEFRLDPGKPGDPPPLNEGNVFRTRIKNQLHEVTVPFDDRSTGFVWFFSFLVLFSQVKKKYGNDLVLLLDEPGLSLHGKAQGDLLRYFRERLCPSHQVIFTTHSPFMVPSDNLLCARTVEDVVIESNGMPEVLGTKVGDDVLSTDKETLFPLQGALGYEITQTLFVGMHTLLVEGPSDILYLKAMSEELRARGRTPLDDRWVVCPAGGIDKVTAFMSLFGGNELHVAVLTDFAHGQKRRVDELRRSQILRQGHVFTADHYAAQPEADVEDLLGAALYVDIVNRCYALDPAHAVAPPAATGRIVKHVENHFRTLPPSVPELDHFAPAAYFLEHRASVVRQAGHIDDALNRFEALFVDLNALLR